MSKTIEHAEIALASAQSAYRSELEQDCNRSEGSGAQERRRDEHQRSLRDEVSRCERDLEEAKRVGAVGSVTDEEGVGQPAPIYANGNLVHQSTD